MEDRIAAFMQQHGLPATAREELEQMLQGYGMPVGALGALPDSQADSTLMFDPDAAADETTARGVGFDDAHDRAERYEDLAFIGRGAFAEVRRVRDRALNRIMAMKVLDRKKGVVSGPMRARFVQEAQATAQLQHPGIVPVHELGVLPDGRLFFTMEEVRGRTLSAVVQAVHDVSIDVWARTEDDWTLRRLVEVFRRVTEAVAYAHSRGVVHRDLKPANIMVGAFGEVRVMDWGIAKVLGSALGTPIATGGDAMSTRDGLVAGTPAFMAPEQARGEVHRLDRRTDVYALGSILHYVLRNAPPYDGSSSSQVLASVARGEPAPLVGRSDGPLLPPELVAIATRAMQAEPDDRYPDARQLGDEIAAWLDGAERREAALRAVGRSAEARRRGKKLRRRAHGLDSSAEYSLDQLPSWAPESEKAPYWEQQDEARDVEREARRQELLVERELNAAFAHEAELPEGHLMMARMYRKKHQEAEAEGDVLEVERLEWLLREHIDALPPHWPGLRRLQQYLVGAGSLALDTDPPTDVVLYRFRKRSRRFVPERVAELGRTPIHTELEMGRYLLELTDAAGDLFVHPVHVRRQAAVVHHPPDTDAPVPLVLADDIEPGEAFVPAGWFIAGGDERAPYGLVERRLWCDAFAIQVFPITHGEWVQFLAEVSESERFIPRNDDGDLLYTRKDEGWSLEKPTGGQWLPDAPVTHITWSCAEQYAAWRAERDGVAWRLPFELEWEKAARGVDGRMLPWGDTVDPSQCNLRGSLEGPPRVVEVDQFPTDISVYGVRGLAGNTADWCADAYESGGPVVAGNRVVLDEGSGTARFRSVRGGSYRDGVEAVRCASRWRALPESRSGRVGIRLARSID